VILVDANLLIYAHNESFDQHEAAKDWLDKALNDVGSVGLPWNSLLAFLRVSTNPRLLQRPVPMSVALQQVGAWLECDPVWIPQPTERHAEVLGSLLAPAGLYGNLVSDAHLAAIALEHGLILCSTDSDFARFSGLRFLNPLAA
jgi:toxin-antitoxin system PIN domain toxin